MRDADLSWKVELGGYSKQEVGKVEEEVKEEVCVYVGGGGSIN